MMVLLNLAANITVSANAPLQNGPLDERVRSLQVRHTSSEMLPDVVVTGTDDALLVTFDLIADDYSNLRYRLIPCNYDWTPSNLTDNEILDRFNEEIIEDYEYSQGTTVNYVNYRFYALSPEMRPKISGNYMIEIFEENNPDRALARVKAAVCQPEVDISASVSTVTDVDYNDRHQQLALKVDNRNGAVDDMLDNIKVTVTQNRVPGLTRVLAHPVKYTRSQAEYKHLPELIFDGGNEYLRFETVTTRYLPMNVEALSYQDPYYRFVLVTDKPRANTQYLYDRTQRGRYKVRNADIRSDEQLQSDIQADYGVVYFSLEMPQNLGKVHLIGDFNQNHINPDSEMTYNNLTGRYEKAMLLKQGAYNYRYVCENDITGKISNCIDGNHYNTVNEYEIRVYYRRPGDRSDRLLGVLSINTEL